MEFYLESPAIPEEVRHKVTDELALGEEVSRTPGKGRISRDLQVGVVMSRDQAKSLADWINKTLAQYEKAVGSDSV